LQVQCNESRTDDAPSADVATSNPTSVGKKPSEGGMGYTPLSGLLFVLCYYFSLFNLQNCSVSGPTHVLVVRGLDENADEEMLRYEFAKHAPIKVISTIHAAC